MKLKMKVYQQDVEQGTYGIELTAIVPLKYQAIPWNKAKSLEKAFESKASKVLKRIEKAFTSKDTFMRKPSGTTMYCNKKEINFVREALISFWHGNEIEIYGHLESASKAGGFDLEMK